MGNGISRLGGDAPLRGNTAGTIEVSIISGDEEVLSHHRATSCGSDVNGAGGGNGWPAEAMPASDDFDDLSSLGDGTLLRHRDHRSSCDARQAHAVRRRT